ncbi:hypothetical protein ACVWYH_005859 [Bradyrhizobium sp. GM24.11]
MPATPNVERHFTASESVRDVVIDRKYDAADEPTPPARWFRGFDFPKLQNDGNLGRCGAALVLHYGATPSKTGGSGNALF